MVRKACKNAETTHVAKIKCDKFTVPNTRWITPFHLNKIMPIFLPVLFNQAFRHLTNRNIDKITMHYLKTTDVLKHSQPDFDWVRQILPLLFFTVLWEMWCLLSVDAGIDYVCIKIEDILIQTQ